MKITLIGLYLLFGILFGTVTSDEEKLKVFYFIGILYLVVGIILVVNLLK